MCDFSSFSTVASIFLASRATISLAIPLPLVMYDIFKSYNWNIKYRSHRDMHFDAEILILKFSSLTDSNPLHLPLQISFHHTFRNRSFVSFKKETVLQGVLSFFMYSVCLTQFSQHQRTRWQLHLYLFGFLDCYLGRGPCLDMPMLICMLSFEHLVLFK